MKQVFILLLALFCIIGCKKNPSRNETSKESETDKKELEPLAYTIYTDKSELFVEFKPLVIGQESRFAAHFTSLGELFKPVIQGSVKLTLSGIENSQTVEANAPSNPGIFRLALTPQKEGLYKLIFDINTSNYTDQIIIDSVYVYKDEETALATQKEEAGGSNEITYLKEQAWKIDFATMPVKREPFNNIIKTSGLVQAPPGDEQIVVSKTNGVISFSKNNLLAGTNVSSGQQLFSVSSSDLTDNNINLRLLEARNNYEKAKANYERIQSLYLDKLVTQDEFLQSKNIYENAEAILNSLSSNYDELSGQTITASQTGFIKSILVTDGQYVETGQSLAVISRSNRLVIRAELSQTAFNKISSISSANFKINDKVTNTIKELNGRLVSIGKSADNNLFIPVFFEIDNTADIIPGSFIEVYIKSDFTSDALVIPLSSLLEEQGIFYCYVQTAGESFEKRELQVGGNDGINVQVISGIEEGERVVTKGAYNIKLSTASGTLPAHGHEH